MRTALAFCQWAPVCLTCRSALPLFRRRDRHCGHAAFFFSRIGLSLGLGFNRLSHRNNRRRRSSEVQAAVPGDYPFHVLRTDRRGQRKPRWHSVSKQMAILESLSTTVEACAVP